MKKITVFLFGLVLLPMVALSLPAQGQEGARKQAPMRKRVPDFVLKKFDKDRNGKLSDTERQEMRKAWRSRAAQRESSFTQDMLTPRYYTSGKNSAFKSKVDHFIEAVRKEKFHHPLKNSRGAVSEYTVPFMGKFGVPKGPQGSEEHHAAVDLQPQDSATNVEIHAAHDGIVHSVRDAPKYRHYLSVTKEIKDDKRRLVGKLVTIYAHVDLDLDEAASLLLDGKQVRKGDLISKHLYAKTRGGPHLHFEIRYYKPDDKGNETFYGFLGRRELALSEPSAGPFSLGYWNSGIGFGFGIPAHHGLSRL